MSDAKANPGPTLGPEIPSGIEVPEVVTGDMVEGSGERP